MEYLNNLIFDVIDYLGVFGPLFGCLLILIESIIPVLPLFVFISLNFITFGNIFGLLISWIFTVFGCMLSFYLFRYKVRNKFNIKFRDRQKVNDVMNCIDKVPFRYLVIVLANPFLPAFLFNIGAGLSKISSRKYFISLLVGKIFLVYFWGFIGTSLLQSLMHPLILVRTVVILVFAYLIGSFVGKKYNLK